MENQTAPLTIARRQINILIVDDRPENLLTLESILEREGRNIIKAGGGNEALRISIREEIGLILLDIQMPDIDGYEVAILLRSNTRTRHIPIIFVSAVTNSEKPSLANFEEGTVDCLCKPLDLDETLSKVALFEQLYHARVEKNDLMSKTQQLQKSLEQFIYIVSHDLKAPLRAIENLSSWIAEDLGPVANVNTTENLSLLQSRVNRMSALLDGILEYSRSSRLEETPVVINLGGMVHAIWESIAPPAGFRLEVQSLPEVLIGETRLYKILFHLISNAVIHHDNPANGRLIISNVNEGNRNVISIEDNGPGIKVQYAEKVFEIFSTLSARDDKDTVGAGLAIVKILLNDAGQQVWLEPASEKGCVFKFSLPA